MFINRKFKRSKNQHTMNKQYERERQRLASGIEELRDKLMQIEAENSDLKVNMAHRINVSFNSFKRSC